YSTCSGDLNPLQHCWHMYNLAAAPFCIHASQGSACQPYVCSSHLVEPRHSNRHLPGALPTCGYQYTAMNINRGEKLNLENVVKDLLSRASDKAKSGKLEEAESQLRYAIEIWQSPATLLFVGLLDELSKLLKMQADKMKRNKRAKLAS